MVSRAVRLRTPGLRQGFFLGGEVTGKSLPLESEGHGGMEAVNRSQLARTEKRVDSPSDLLLWLPSASSGCLEGRTEKGDQFDQYGGYS